MKTHRSNAKTQVYKMPPMIKKVVDDKAIIQAYLRGEVSKDELNKRGIELAQPL